MSDLSLLPTISRGYAQNLTVHLAGHLEGVECHVVCTWSPPAACRLPGSCQLGGKHSLPSLHFDQQALNSLYPLHSFVSPYTHPRPRPRSPGHLGPTQHATRSHLSSSLIFLLISTSQNMLGGTPRCERCNGAVYHAEQVMGPGRRVSSYITY